MIQKGYDIAEHCECAWDLGTLANVAIWNAWNVHLRSEAGKVYLDASVCGLRFERFSRLCHRGANIISLGAGG